MGLLLYWHLHQRQIHGGTSVVARSGGNVSISKKRALLHSRIKFVLHGSVREVLSPRNKVRVSPCRSITVIYFQFHLVSLSNRCSLFQRSSCFSGQVTSRLKVATVWRAHKVVKSSVPYLLDDVLILNPDKVFRNGHNSVVTIIA